MANKPIKISLIADTKELGSGLSSAERALTEAGATAQKAANKVESSFSGVATGADNVASKGSQAAGALSGLGGLATLAGGKVGALGTAMTVAGVATQGLADAGDLLNVVTESKIVKTTVATARTIASTAAEKAATIGTKAWTVAQRVLNAVLKANPIGLVITALTLLAAGLVLAYKKSDTFRAIVNKAFALVKAAGTSLWNTLRGAFNSIKSALGAVGSAATGVWNAVKSAFDKIWDKISALPGRISGMAGKMLSAGKTLISNLVGGFGSIGSDLAGKLKSAINSVLHLPLTIPSISVAGHHIGGQTLIPALANGGIVSSPTLALIGEAGPEAVVPLSRLGTGGAGVTYNVYLNGTFLGSKTDLARWVRDGLDDLDRKGGRRRAA